MDGYVKVQMRNPGAGLVSKAFCGALHSELMEYYRLISTLEGQVTVQASRVDNVAITLHRLTVWTHEPLIRMQMLAVLADGCRGLKGGALASAIHRHATHGDPYIQDLVKRTLEASAGDPPPSPLP